MRNTPASTRLVAAQLPALPPFACSRLTAWLRAFLCVRAAFVGIHWVGLQVLLSHGERAELATEEYLAVTTLLEGIVILKPNPDYVKEENLKD